LTDRRIAAGAALKPTVAVGAGLDYARPNPRIFPRADEWNESWDVSVHVAWSFWDGGRTKARMEEVAAGQRALEQRLAEFDRTLDFEVRQRHGSNSSRRGRQSARRPMASAAPPRPYGW
jgi:outer membrane protein TolC